MRLFLNILLLLTFALSLSCCRCVRHSSSSLARTDTSAIDVRFRSLSQLRDTCAERQTIRIEYQPYVYWAFATADTTDTASSVGSVPPGNTGGGVPAIKSIEIITERNSGSSLNSTTDSTRLSQTSTKETLQEEAASETKPDQGSVFSSTLAIGLVVVVVVVLLFTVGKKYLKANFPWIFAIKKWLDKLTKL